MGFLYNSERGIVKSLIVGFGEIGKAVREVIVDYDKVDTYDKKDDDLYFDTNTDILHICFPYSEKFIDEVQWYIDGVKPWHVIIWSTVPIGTTRNFKGAVHSPVNGVHPNLTRSIKSSVRWIGANDEIEGVFFEQYFKNVFLSTRLVGSSDFTELLKLQSTAMYGINLVFTDYISDITKELDMDFELVKKFNRDYNKLYHNLGMDWAQQYILNPPNGHIGGHCIRENSKLLDEQFPHEMLKQIGEME